MGAARRRAVAPSRPAMHAHQEVSADGDKLRALVHELRNAVAPIVNATYLLRRRVGADRELSEMLALMERQLAEMVATIDGIADLRHVPVDAPTQIERDHTG